jgi:drug/metabolite transporter (DMT)-like permease
MASMTRRFQYSLRAMLFGITAIGPAILIGRWLLSRVEAIIPSLILAFIGGSLGLVLCATCFFAGLYYDRKRLRRERATARNGSE